MGNQLKMTVARERSNERNVPRLSKKALFGTALFLSACSAIALFFAQRHDASGTGVLSKPNYSRLLTIDPESRDFGEVWSTDTFNWG